MLDEDAAHRLAESGAVIMPAARWFVVGAMACVANLPAGARYAAIRGAIGRLAEDDSALALHALAQAYRVQRDAQICAAHPDPAEVVRRDLGRGVQGRRQDRPW